MVSKILVMSRQQMKSMIKFTHSMESTAIISICSEESEKLMTEHRRALLASKNCNDVLSVCFADLTDKEKKIENISRKYLFFNEDKARQIISFLDVLRDKNIVNLLIHCDAGVSRSGAVGIFAVRYYGLDEKKFLEENIIHPNSFVYDTLVEVSGLRGNYVKFWEFSRYK